MILLTGFTGNTGSIVLEKLLKTVPANQIVGITRNTDYFNKHNICVENVALEDEQGVEQLFKKYNFTGIIHIANIRYSPLLMSLANKYKVPKIVLVHTTGIYSKYRAYSKLYKEIEGKILSNSYPNTSYTILRPTMIYGNERDHNMHKLIKFLAKYPVFPVFGDGRALMQPVHVEDLADGIIRAYEKDIANNKDYDLSGGSVVEYRQVLNLITAELNKKVIFIYIPIKLAIFAAKVYNALFGKRAIITVEQVERLQEDKSYSNEKARLELGFSPRPFEQGIVEEINLMKKKGLI
jgi:nucleoside-diphosphate-sugar epimerase